MSRKRESKGYDAIINLLNGNELTPDQKLQLATQIAKVEQIKSSLEVMARRFKVVAERNAGQAAKMKKQKNGILDD